MNGSPTSAELYAFSCREFSFLVDLGYQAKVGTDMAEFVSSSKKFFIYKDRYGEPPMYKLHSAVNNMELTSPVTALQYYLDDYLQEWAAQEAIYSDLPDALRTIKILAVLLKINSWIFTTSRWFGDVAFVRAVEETREWFQKKLSGGTFPSHAECIAHLREFRSSGEVARAQVGLSSWGSL